MSNLEDDLDVNPGILLDIIRRDQQKLISEETFRSLEKEAIHGLSLAPDNSWIYTNTDLNLAVEKFRSIYNSGKLLISSTIAIREKKRPNGKINNSLYKTFHLCKSMLQIKKYGTPNINIVEAWKDVEREFYIQKAAADLNEAFNQVCVDDADKIQLIRELMDAAGLQNIKIAFKGAVEAKEKRNINPSELWIDAREIGKENPAQFVKRVYAQYLDDPITWGDIRRADEKLYHSYVQWSLRRHNNPDVVLLNSKILNRTQAANARIATQLKEQGSGVGWTDDQSYPASAP